jgi:hypothetical protein
MNAGPYSDEKVQKFIEEEFIPLKSQCFFDKRTDLMKEFDIKWTPTLLIHDSKGYVFIPLWQRSVRLATEGIKGDFKNKCTQL